MEYTYLDVCDAAECVKQALWCCCVTTPLSAQLMARRKFNLIIRSLRACPDVKCLHMAKARMEGVVV